MDQDNSNVQSFVWIANCDGYKDVMLHMTITARLGLLMPAHLVWAVFVLTQFNNTQLSLY